MTLGSFGPGTYRFRDARVSEPQEGGQTAQKSEDWMLLRRLAKTLVCATLLLTASCNTFSWQGRGLVSDEQEALGVKDVKALERDYDTQRYWSSVRRDMSGRWAAASRGFDSIVESFDRNFLNYDRDDTYMRH